jgi:competence protein ComGC
VELLTVIAVISVLSILVVAGLGVVRENANQTKCAANLRQIYVACNLYSNEHGMKLIPANTLNALNDGDYLSKNSEVWICPTPRRSCTATTSRRVPGAGRAT